MLANAVRDLDALEEVHALNCDDVVRELSAVIGRPMVALLADVGETKMVAKWERGEVTPKHARELTLKTALQLVRILQPRYQRGSVASWLSGINPRLENDAPLEVLARMAHEYSPDQARRVLNAAKAFANR